MIASKQKTVLITGASSGIGYGIAEAYLALGANVVLNGRNEKNLAAAADRLGNKDRIAIVAGNIGEKKTAEKLVEVALERFGSVDVLINNAGVFATKSIDDYSEDDLDSFLTNLKGAFFASQAVVGRMREQGGGSIINITSILANRGIKAIPATAPMAAKGGINSVSNNLAIELAADNIRVNTIAPGIIKTPIYGLKDDEFDKLNSMQPLGRVGEVSDIVDAVLYLDNANFVTGVILPVDGGAAVGG